VTAERDASTGPMRMALDLAWASACAGSLGVGAVITDAQGTVVATGRNRLAESDPGDDHLAGTSLAHAEMNALAKLRWRAHRHDRLVLWTTLEPCLQCAGALRVGPISEVQVLAPDPIFPSMDQLRAVTHLTARPWPDWHRWPATEAAVFGLVLHTHAFLTLGIDMPAWQAGLPLVSALTRSLLDRDALRRFAADGIGVDAVIAALAPDLRPALPDVEALLAAAARTGV
jgi:tRNA(Arg) A34 adenosine deaminase TadA